ncbi:alpha/beta fold hydrolase [Geodermatophilus ruber]|uniref:Pimeloyl-ACP methyl ester carboxylesterase n=1 Tax=Geodermatophilus ruber TaxID=504800 RepID=A0A1I4G991_9ACTN|nr:alpha/beta hydrolase [Geodermatophilus ruber]SFL26554.1 Pimeloyl-ACP methyl ester carboxylesterase [Geodermatophilus ruber]
MPTPKTETIQLDHCGFEAKVKVAGSGSPVLYLHTAGGPRWDVLLDALAEEHTVYAPDHPGTGETDRYSIHQIDTLWDLVLAYDELLDRLGLSEVAIVGSSFGGMMAAEVAAHRPDRVSKLVLMSAIGLWRDDAPVAQYMLMPPDDLVTTLFADTSPAPVQAFLTPPADFKEAAVAQADLIWALGTTGKFVWPIPDKGLHKRLHRITAPTLVLWGDKDALVSAAYAEEFAARIADSRVEIIDGAGHVPQWEKADAVIPLVQDFLKE